MTEDFTIRRQVEFNHCDPAGIVFYPRYFEMISALVERFFADGVHYSWGRMGAEPGAPGTPLGEITVRFSAPSRLEDWLDLSVQITRLGTSSATLALTCACAGETRFTGEATVIYAKISEGRAAPWPEPLRRAMGRYLLPPQDS